jgi:hypothetical protein
VFGEDRPGAFEGVQALRPWGGEDQRLVAIAIALGAANVDAVDGLMLEGDGVHVQLLTTLGVRATLRRRLHVQRQHRAAAARFASPGG